jgi:hypothetical protein
MNLDDLERFAEDLLQHAGLTVELLPDPDPTGLHVLRINQVDYFFHADGTGYDGWGKFILPPT